MSLIEYEECVITGSILPPSVKRQETDINKSGIYKIINRTNGHYYVGSAGKVRNRWNDHKRFLRQNRHPNSHLQYAWNKYGSDAFEFIQIPVHRGQVRRGTLFLESIPAPGANNGFPS